MNSEGVQYLLKMSETLAEMNGRIGQLCERLAAHEARLTQLERNRPGEKEKGLSDTLVKIILYLAAAAAALSGAGSFLFK